MSSFQVTMNRISIFGFTCTVLSLWMYTEDSVDNGRSSTAGFPEICIGVIKKGPLSSTKGGKLGPGTRTIEYPGFTKNLIFVSYHPIKNLLDRVHLLQDFPLVSQLLIHTYFEFIAALLLKLCFRNPVPKAL